MSAIAVIPAKGHSSRIPRKNEKLFHGRPILYYSIKAAQDSGLFGAIVVSTDDDRIGRIAEGYGARWYHRDSALTVDNIGTQVVTRDVLQSELKAGEPWANACCIYPCAPTMTADDIQFGHRVFESVKDTFGFVYVPAWFYWGRSAQFIQMEMIRGSNSHCITPDQARWVDINTPDDWSRAEAMYAALHEVSA